MHRALVLFTFAMVSAITSTGAAAPYEFVAIYTSRLTPRLEPLVVKLANKKVYPSITNEWAFDRVAVRFQDGMLLDGDTFAIEKFHFQRWMNSVEEKRPQRWRNQSVPGGSAAGKTIDLFDYPMMHSSEPIDRIELSIGFVYKQDYLCAQETALRKKGADIKGAAPALAATSMSFLAAIAPGREKSGKAKDLATAMGGKMLIDEASKAPILYSFCADIRNLIDWEGVAEVTRAHPELGLADLKVLAPAKDLHRQTELYTELYKAHKAALVELLAARLPTFAMGARPALVPVHEPRTVVPSGTMLEVSGSISFEVIHDFGGMLELIETNSSEGTLQVGEVNGIVNQSSTLRLRTKETANTSRLWNQSSCQHPFELLKIEMDTEDDKGNALPKTIALDTLANSHDARLKVSLPDFLEKKVTIKVLIMIGDTPSVLMQIGPFTVKNLGFVTTFPGVTEIATLLQRYNAKDQGVSSTVPVSWAVNLSSKQVGNIAVTLPWMISYNSRRNPDFARYFSFFPHVTLIVGQDPATQDPMRQASSTPNVTFAAGVGVSLLRLFQFSWAVSHQGDQYVLVGLSIPDLAKLAF